MPIYTYTTLDDPLGETIATGINDSGQIIVYAGGPGSYLFSAGTYTYLADPRVTTGTHLTGINDSGQIVGYDSNGYLYSDGTFTILPFNPLSNNGSVPTGINNAGQIVGYFSVINNGPYGLTLSSGTYGFLYSGGTYTALDDPLATNGTYATGINNVGQIVGYYGNTSGTHGFVFSDGTYTTLDDPLATNNGTYATGINDSGQMVGYYLTAPTGIHGFLYSNGIYTTIDDPLGVGGSQALGINDKGRIVGSYNPHGFLLTITPDTPAAPADSAVINGYVNAANDTAAQVLTGTADNNSTVTVYDNGNFVGSTTADPSTGAWSFPIGQLADGSTHSYTVTATDADGNVSQPSTALSFTVDTTIPAVTAIAETSGLGSDLNAGKTVTITLTTSEAVVVTGAPTLALNDNGTATYSGISADGKTLTFTYTVASADTDVPSLQVSSINLPSGAMIQDAAGNNLSLSLSGLSQSGPQIDTDANEQGSLKLTVTTTAISAATAPLVPFSIAGLESEDTGTVTFTDVNNKTVVVNVNGSQTSYLANLSTLADGTITSSLAVNSDPAGNAFTPVAGNNVALTQLDHWTATLGGNWATASSWTTWNGTHAVPTGAIDADFDKSGTYTVKITTADTAYALLLNDTGATISDNSGGALTLAGTGGSSNPNGPLSINAGSFALAGGVLNSGAISIAGGNLTISGNYTGSRAISQAITDNGTMTISGSAAFAGAITGSGIVNIQKGAAATFISTITGSETFNISGTMTISGAGRAVISTPVSGTGSFILSNSASLEFAARDAENITFSPGATGSLKFDDSLNAQFFTGQLSGLSTQGANSVDLADLPWVQGKMSASYKGTPKGGTLTISNGTNKVSLNLLGNYTGASWMLSQDGGTGTLVKDPPVSGSLGAVANGGASLDRPGISFDVDTTLAYWMNTANTGGTLTGSDSPHAQSVALLAQYMASSFVMPSGAHGGTLITEPPSHQELFLTHPHA
jgi:probable HAF family extracellular repeat protein